MTSEIDVWRSAHLIIEQHGNDAELQAAMRADALLEWCRNVRIGETLLA